MKQLSVTLWTEYFKIRRSKIFWITLVLFVFVAAMMGMLMFVQKYPEISGKLGMIGNKATMLRFGEPNWANFFKLLIQGIAGVGIVGSGFVTSWVFGREYADNTMKDILVLPVSRTYIVLSKFIVIVLWSAILSIVYFLSGLLAGLLIGLPGLNGSTLSKIIHTYAMTSLLMILLCTPVAFIANYGRGYLLPLAFVILTLILANFSGLVGLGPYFPWAIPGLYGTPSGADGMQLNIASYIILISTSLLGLFGTIAFWRYADHK